MTKLAVRLLACSLAGAFVLSYGAAVSLAPAAWVFNGHFDESTVSWEPPAQDGVTFGWSAEDRDGSRVSGSAQISIEAGASVNPFALQCRPIPIGAATATVSGSIRYPADFGDSNAWLQGSWFSGPGCTGAFIPDSFGGSVHVPQVGWTDITATVPIPPNATSVAIQFGFATDIGAPALAANFDDLALVFDHMPAHRVVASNLARE